MSNKQLLTKAMVNSFLLAIMFTITTMQSFAAGNTVSAVIGLLAVFFTVNDAVTFRDASKQQTEEGTK